MDPHPSFKDFFGEDFFKDKGDSVYQPLNNATEISPFQDPASDQDKEADGSKTPPSYYRPRKTIALTPAMVEIVLENGVQIFDGIINGIREYAWLKARSFKKKETRKQYLEYIYYTLQAFWAHGQTLEQTDITETTTSMVHCEPSNVATITKSDWALEKTTATSDALALTQGCFKNAWKCDSEDYSHEGSSDPDTETERKRNTRESSETVVVDFLANMINKATNRDASNLTNTAWAFKAIKLASSISKTERVTEVSKGLQELMKYPEKNAREIIAHDLNLRRRAQFRIDKTMATFMKSSQVFRLDPELTGNISFFHFFPRDAFEMQDIISGEELENRVKVKGISGSAVSKMYEQKYGIATDAEMLSDQAFNFWQYNCFMFGDESWIAKKIAELYTILTTFKKEIRSIATNEKNYIALVAAKINNEYHLFLTSCLDADDDLSKVGWNYIENLALEIKSSIQNRSKPNYVLTSMIRAIADQSKQEVKRKRDAENLAHRTGFTPPRKNNKDKNKHRVRFRDDDSADDNSDDEREDDPRQVNLKVNPKWKMTGKDFKEVISPNTPKCPKLKGKSICARYNILGRCFFGSRCHHSHEELTGRVKEEFGKWISDCKKKAKENDNKDEKKRKDGADE